MKARRLKVMEALRRTMEKEPLPQEKELLRPAEKELLHPAEKELLRQAARGLLPAPSSL